MVEKAQSIVDQLQKSRVVQFSALNRFLSRVYKDPDNAHVDFNDADVINELNFLEHQYFTYKQEEKMAKKNNMRFNGNKFLWTSEKQNLQRFEDFTKAEIHAGLLFGGHGLYFPHCLLLV